MRSRLGLARLRSGRSNTQCETGLNDTTTSVVREGMRLPVTSRNGTPAQRQLSIQALRATKVSTSLSWVKPLTASPSTRSEEHTSELQSLMRISYAVFCLKKKKNK